MKWTKLVISGTETAAPEWTLLRSLAATKKLNSGMHPKVFHNCTTHS